MGRTILIDADILVYQIASSQEAVFDFDGNHVLHADLNAGIREVKNSLEYILDHTDSDQASLFLTGTNNFRKTVLHTYKANRAGTRRPMILGGLREFMIDTYKQCFLEDTLEGDDLIGIHATMPHKGERVVYSADKDLRTVPGLHWDQEDGEIIEVSNHDADTFFFEQILTGDPTDNYAGCPGVGKVNAKAFLEEPFKFVPQTRELKSGPNKGQERTTWLKEPTDDIWEGIVSHYVKAGLTEKGALTQARCARILRHGEFNFDTQEVSLWNPQ